MKPLLLLLLALLLTNSGSAQTLIPYRQGQLWGYADSTRQVVIAPQYHYAEPFQAGLGKVWRAGKCGFINPVGQEVVPVRWDAASYPPDAAAQKLLTYSYENYPTPAERAAAGRWLARWVVVWARTDSTAAAAPGSWDEGFQYQPYAKDAYRAGLYTPGGQLVLPAQYVYFRPLSARYYAAGYVVGTHLFDGSHGCIRQEPYEVPSYKEKLLHHSGRLLLDSLRFQQLAGLYGDKLVADWGSAVLSPSAWLLDTLGRTWLQPRPTDSWQSLVPFGPTGQLWVGTNTRFSKGEEQGGVMLLRTDGTPVLPQRYHALTYLDDQRAFATMVIPNPNPTQNTDYLQSEWGASHYAGTPDVVARMGVLAWRTGRWLVPPQNEVLYPVGAYLKSRRHGRWGVLDARGNIRIAFRYKELTPVLGAAGQPLPIWDAYGPTQHQLLGPDGQVLLTLPPRVGLAARIGPDNRLKATDYARPERALSVVIQNRGPAFTARLLPLRAAPLAPSAGPPTAPHDSWTNPGRPAAAGPDLVWGEDEHLFRLATREGQQLLTRPAPGSYWLEVVPAGPHYWLLRLTNQLSKKVEPIGYVDAQGRPFFAE